MGTNLIDFTLVHVVDPLQLFCGYFSLLEHPPSSPFLYAILVSKKPITTSEDG